MVKKVPKKEKSKKSSTEQEPKEKSEQKIQKKSKRELQNEEGIDQNQNSTGVIYVGHLPWGFIDSTIKKYFEQFGPITRIICPKSSKTGRSVGYAFIEFGDEETARIAAKTMNNYILFEKILKCSYVEDKTKYDRIFLKWKKKFEFKQRYKEHCEKINKKKSNEEIKILVQGLLDREEKRREKMKEMGIDYEYKGYKEIVDEYKNTHKKEIMEKNKNRKNEKNVKEKKEKKEKKENINKDNIKNTKKDNNKNKKQKEELIEQEKDIEKSDENKEEEEDEENEEIKQEEEEGIELEDEEMEDEGDEEEDMDVEEDEEEEEEEEEVEIKVKNKKGDKHNNMKKIETVKKQKKLDKMKEKEKQRQKENKMNIKNKKTEIIKGKNKNNKK